ncbi:hypothetical protein EBR43_07375 [bacterium]|nr:hypothetical protein [bacterium]
MIKEEEVPWPIIIIVIMLFLYPITFFLGADNARNNTQREMSIFTVKVINNIKKQLPVETKLKDIIPKDDFDSLNYESQEIIKLH